MPFFFKEIAEGPFHFKFQVQTLLVYRWEDTQCIVFTGEINFYHPSVYMLSMIHHYLIVT